MNPDLAMAEELLRKTRTGNLFTVFGQPDIDIRPAAGGAGGGAPGGQPQLQVQFHSLDVYDPTTGVVRSDSTVSRPFPRPASGRIAVKVINHYGDEILKVYGV